MRKIHKQQLAESDLLDIWQYSYEEWGVAQADRYLDELEENITLLIESPELGVERDLVRPGYRVLFVNSHAVYYTVAPAFIHIVRVLHVRMDPGKHL